MQTVKGATWALYNGWHQAVWDMPIQLRDSSPNLPGRGGVRCEFPHGQGPVVLSSLHFSVQRRRLRGIPAPPVGHSLLMDGAMRTSLPRLAAAALACSLLAGCAPPPGGVSAGGPSPAAGWPGATTNSTLTNGTGFYVDSRGHLVTAGHVVESCDALFVMREEGRQAAALVAASRRADLALLKTATGPGTYAVFAPARGLVRGQALFAFGYPSPRKSASIFAVRGAVMDERPPVPLDAAFGPGEVFEFLTGTPVRPGNSGGPLLDRTGSVIGVMTARLDLLRNIAYGIDAVRVRGFLADAGVELIPAAGGGAWSGQRHLERQAEKFTYPVICIPR